MLIHTDCRHFRGTTPCEPHKLHGIHCDECSYYDRTSSNVLIIKLGAIGDVIRTTPLLHRLKQDYPQAKIWWLTRTPEILPPLVDVRLPFQIETILTLEETPFKLALNLDKDTDACAVMNRIKSETKHGFMLKDGLCSPIDESARAKFETGIFDDISKANKKTYLDEIFEISGYKFQGERYIIPFEPCKEKRWKFARGKKVVGLNTGCGGRWTSRLWPEAYWAQLAVKLKRNGYEVLLLGGEQEDRLNRRLAKRTKARYFGFYPLAGFINLIDQCDLVVTAVTMAMHITIGLKKKIVLFNNIFNRNEFELYGLGEILEPDFECDCYYSPTCKNNCMQYLKPERVVNSVQKLLPKK